MRLSIDHRTTYRFAEPQHRVVQMLRMTPENTHDQTIANWHIAVDCDARMRRHRDGFGNCTTMLYAEGPLETIEITVSGEVVTSHSNGEVHGTNEPLPPPLFMRTTPATAADAAIAAFAIEMAGEGRSSRSAGPPQQSDQGAVSDRTHPPRTRPDRRGCLRHQDRDIARPRPHLHRRGAQP